MITEVDTNVVLDLLLPDEPRTERSKEVLKQVARQGALVICEPVYAELAFRFPNREAFEQFLSDTGLNLLPSRPASLFRASEAWGAYLRHRPSGFACGRCGHEQRVYCESCGNEFRTRQHVAADFIIGAHATMQADRLLTHDRRYFGTYFPELQLV